MMISLIRVLAWLAALPYVAVVLLVLTGPPTWSGVAYLTGIGLLLGGVMTLPKAKSEIYDEDESPTDANGEPKIRRRGVSQNRVSQNRVFGVRRPRGITRGALLSLIAIAFVRGCSARSGETLHFSPDARMIDRLIDEQDIAVSGTRVLVASGMLHDDAAELPSAMRASYAKMRAEEGDAPSPVLATYLGMQGPTAFDLLVLEPHNKSDTTTPVTREGADTPRDDAGAGAVIFLHGFAGNFALPCWQMARAVAPSGFLTVCPSTRWVGDWWSPEGEEILRRTVEALHTRGISRIVLAGLSNGGIGASRLAPRMRGTFVGLVLISGEEPDAPGAGIPTLVVHGTHDTMTAYSAARVYVKKTGARLVTLDAGHFAMLVRSEAHDRAVLEFIQHLPATSGPRS